MTGGLGRGRAARDRLAAAAAAVRVTAMLAVVEVGVRVVPLPRLCRALGVELAPPTGNGPAPAGGGPGLRGWERRQARILRRVAPRWPFGRGPCLRESLVLGHVLRRHRPVLRIGVARRDGEVMAHSWLEVGGAVFGQELGFSPLGLAVEAPAVPAPPTRSWGDRRPA